MSIVLDGTTGITTPGLTNTGTETLVNLTTTGNTTLGDATTDTLTVGVTGIVKDASGNVGIGTASPSTKLHVTGAITAATTGQFFVSNGASTTNQYFNVLNTGGSFFLGVESSGGGSLATGSTAYASLLTTQGATPLQFGTNLNVRATIDTSGNLGLGVTPSAWSGFTALQMANGVGLSSASGSSNTQLTSNAYYNGSAWTYIASAYATKYTQVSGQHQWFNAPSSTGAISFTQAMTLDASGNLGVGHTATGSYGRFSYSSNAGTTVVGGYTDASIGWFGTGTNHALALGTGGSERARIDTSGRFYVGLTSPINGSQTAVSGDLTAVNGVSYQSTATTGTATYAAFYYNGTNKGTITGTSTAASYNTGASDYRLKENITDLTGGLEKINLLRPVSFTWIDSKDNDYGFIAHELQSVIPQAISGEKDAVDENGIPKYQSIFPAPAQMIATLVKAIQEQQALIQSLTDRLTALEAK